MNKLQEEVVKFTEVKLKIAELDRFQRLFGTFSWKLFEEMEFVSLNHFHGRSLQGDVHATE